MLLCLEGVLSIAIDCYDATWTGHLELEICIVWHCIESGECDPSEHCVIAAVKGDYVED